MQPPEAPPVSKLCSTEHLAGQLEEYVEELEESVEDEDEYNDSKEKLAKIVITQFHFAEAADAAAEEFRRVHGGGGGGMPDEIPEVTISQDMIQDGKVVPLAPPDGPVFDDPVVPECQFQSVLSLVALTHAPKPVSKSSA